jgi:hypothetical protein
MRLQAQDARQRQRQPYHDHHDRGHDQSISIPFLLNGFHFDSISILKK